MTLVRKLISQRGKRKIFLYRRADGFFSYEEEFEAFDDIAGAYWSSGFQSGIFNSEEAAMKDIEATTPWLRTES